MQLFKRSQIDGSLDLKGDLEQIAKANPHELIYEDFKSSGHLMSAMDQALKYYRENAGSNYLSSSLTTDYIPANGTNFRQADITDHARQVIQAIAAKLSDEDLQPYMYNEVVHPIYEARIKDRMIGAEASKTPKSYSDILAAMYPHSFT